MSRGGTTLQEITLLLIGVQSNPERDVSLASLAAEHGYSPSHFHRIFTEVVGETPKAHVERVRLERAAYRLAVTGESILDIALSVGFRSHETFARAFSRRFNKTPGDWRRLSVQGKENWGKASRSRESSDSTLSEVSYLTLKLMALLAMRRMGKYGTLVHSIMNSGRFALKAGPPVEILREVGIDGHPHRNLNEIYLPVEPIR